jgi:hypothetical protein
MAALTDKFDVIRGWEPGGDASIDQSLVPVTSGGVLVTLLPGYIVSMNTSAEVDVATSPASVALGTANPLQVYIVLEGNDTDFSTQFVGKVVCLRGKLTVKTDKLNVGQTFPINGAVTYSAGLLSDKAAGATTQQIGVVLANNVATDGTITVELDI